MKNELTLSELAEKLSHLKSLDPKLKAFGASAHRYELNPCLRAEDLEEFEKSAGVTLPEQFRDFLLRFGNGGAGPGYGLLSLQESVEEFGNYPLGMIARPFIPSASSNKMEERDYPDDGLIPIAHMGCGHMWVLIVADPDRGTIWNYLSGGDYEPDRIELPDYRLAATMQQRLDANARLTDSLLSNPSRRLKFWDWYLDWLGRTEQAQPIS